MKPYYTDASVTLYLGDMRELLPALDVRPDCVIADPPYGETSLAWDRWPEGWPTQVASYAGSMWCFGSMRMFLDRRDEFECWKLSQDVVWEKDKGSGFATDRFRRVHEQALHWYRGSWSSRHHAVPRVSHDGPDQSRRNKGGDRPGTHGGRRPRAYVDDGTRLMRSVVKAPAGNNLAIHPCQKPIQLISPLIEYACPRGGLVLDPFAGSGTTGIAARLTGRRAVLFEADEATCERAVTQRLSQGDLFALAGTEGHQ